MANNLSALKIYLDKKVDEYHQPFFIDEDPISVPHRYSKLQDIEISAFFAAIFAWGNRTMIIRKSNELMQYMDDAPYDFIRHHSEKDLKQLHQFKHRTFNTTDLFYFITFLKHHYNINQSLESAFTKEFSPSDLHVENALNHFRNYFFSLENAPLRTQKHIPAPFKNSACKRINMFLRWMVRSDKGGVDFGLWKQISPSQLIIPLDLHVHRVALHLQLTTRHIPDWKTALELTETLKKFDPKDPVKYDYALFALGVVEKIK
jgi:uncharacterized protein (TIGR02757 family)